MSKMCCRWVLMVAIDSAISSEMGLRPPHGARAVRRRIKVGFKRSSRDRLRRSGTPLVRHSDEWRCVTGPLETTASQPPRRHTVRIGRDTPRPMCRTARHPAVRRLRVRQPNQMVAKMALEPTANAYRKSGKYRVTQQRADLNNHPYRKQSSPGSAAFDDLTLQ